MRIDPIHSMLLQPDAVPLFTQRDFRDALGAFATGVTIVTTRAPDGALVGLTANSFNSVSLDPPLVLWSLGQRAGSLPIFTGHTHYAINILAADQVELARRFAARGTGESRFAGVEFREGAGGAPVLDGVAAWFECSNRSRYEEGDHVIFVGAVENCGRAMDGDRPRSPLIFHGGQYFAELPL
jgi:flavin reductase (DIM6/NTAB) family NADH-FMN oxidoreductase RutF